MMTYKSTFMLAVLVMCASFVVAHADVKYTRVARTTFPKTTSGPAINVIETDTVFVTPDKMRKEVEGSSDKNSPPTKYVFIRRCDQQQNFFIDESLKIYSVSPISKDGIPEPYIAHGAASKGTIETKTIINFSIQKLAPQKINGFDTQGYSIVKNIRTGDVKGSSKRTVWVADVAGWQDCGSKKLSYKSFSLELKTPKGAIRSTTEYTGDVDEMNKISSELTVRSEETFVTPLSAGTGIDDVNVTSFDQVKKLDDSLFEVPPGYRKVSSQEFYKLQSRAKEKAVQESKKSKTQ